MFFQYEFHAYPGADDGDIVAQADVTHHRVRTESSARSMAGRMAKKIRGPIDIAIAGDADWNERYLTTASPSEFHASGFRFERIE